MNKKIDQANRKEEEIPAGSAGRLRAQKQTGISGKLKDDH